MTKNKLEQRSSRLRSSIIEFTELTPDETIKRMESSETGLTVAEVNSRLEKYGYNEITSRRSKSGLAKYLSHFRNPLIIILLAAGSVSLLLGEAQNVVIIYAIVLLSTYLAYYQESRAEEAAALLKERVSTKASVIREGKRIEVPLSDIVPGDIVCLGAGDIVPADSRVLKAKDLFLNQSSLTGESYPVEKTHSKLEQRSDSLTDWRNILFMGTSVVSGTCTGVALRTGASTEYGSIAESLVEPKPETEFESGLRQFGYLIMQVTLILVIVVFAVNAYSKGDVLNALLFSVALAVGLTPGLLPMITTLNLTKGAIAMSRKGVIVKRLASIQNLGSMNVLCTDKTGTLTENRTKVILHIDIEGKNSDKVILYSYLNSLHQTGLKSPLDEAILGFKDVDTSIYVKVDEIPFDFIRRRVSVVVEEAGTRLMILKGAPEEILRVCTQCEYEGSIVDMTDSLRTMIDQQFYDLSVEGFRVLGVAYRRLKTRKQVYTINDETRMIFLGFVAFLDPPKESAKQSIKAIRDSGVELKVLTGDNELVTRMVCESLGLEIRGILLGSEVAQLTDDALGSAAHTVNVFARVSPVQKERIINVLKDEGFVVGYLGDGINDAPSLKASDVGISVDNAVDIAKESADMILLQNDLTILKDGVIEGRKTFGNTMKYVMMGTSSNFGNMFSVAGGSLFLPFLPMSPLQILLNNMMYDISQSTIGTDSVDSEYTEKPKRWDVKFIRNFMVTLGPISSIFDFATFFIMLFVFRASQQLFQTAWFIESLATQTLVIFSIRTMRTPFWVSRPSRWLTLSCLGVVVVSWALPLTPLGELFGFVRPPLPFWSVLAGLTCLYLVLVEVVKMEFFKRNAQRLEEEVKPRVQRYYMSDDDRLLQYIMAIIVLHSGSSVNIDAVLELLRASVSFKYDERQVVRHIMDLRRLKLITFNPATREIMKEPNTLDQLSRFFEDPRWDKRSVEWRNMMEFLVERGEGVDAEAVSKMGLK